MAVMHIYEVETRRPNGTVVTRFLLPSSAQLNWSDMFGFGQDQVIGLAEAFIREGDGDWRLIARQDEKGKYTFNPGDGMPTPFLIEIGPNYE